MNKNNTANIFLTIATMAFMYCAVVTVDMYRGINSFGNAFAKIVSTWSCFLFGYIANKNADKYVSTRSRKSLINCIISYLLTLIIAIYGLFLIWG